MPTTDATPFTRTVIVGSVNSVGAPSPQVQDGLPRQFQSWSDGGAQNHTAVAPATPTTYTATFGVPPIPAEVCADGLDNDGDGSIDENCGPSPTHDRARTAGEADRAGPGVDSAADVDGADHRRSPDRVSARGGLGAGPAAYQVPLGLATAFSVPSIGAGQLLRARPRRERGRRQRGASNEAAATVGCATRPAPADVDGGGQRCAGVARLGRPGRVQRHQLSPGRRLPAWRGESRPVGRGGQRVHDPRPARHLLRPGGRRQTALGASDPSNEVTLDVGAAARRTALKTILAATLAGSQVTLQWNPLLPATADAVDALWPLSYVLEIGTTAGGSQLGSVPAGRTTAS